MNKWILFFVALCYAEFDPSDRYSEDGPLLKNLTEYIETEYNGAKKYIDENYPFIFDWKFCSMASFPMLLGKRCPYFPDYEKYRSIHWRGSTAYIQDETHVYVGIKYWFSDKEGVPSDTATYQIISYQLIRNSWRKDQKIVTIRTKLDAIFQIIGEPN